MAAPAPEAITKRRPCNRNRYPTIRQSNTRANSEVEKAWSTTGTSFATLAFGYALL
jgi:hypothetical protein